MSVGALHCHCWCVVSWSKYLSESSKCIDGESRGKQDESITALDEVETHVQQSHIEARKSTLEMCA